MDTVYLEDHPPARSQFRRTRRATVTGAIVIHTAENATDLTLPDDGAENVAAFIARRSDAGSYHSIADSDSTVNVGRYEWEMYHEGTGGNRWSLGLSFACKAHQWPSLSPGWVESALQNGATEAANMADWVKTTTGIIVPADRITAADYRSGKPGFISHAELDPGRRSDPGAGFPWARFLDIYKRSQQSPVDPVSGHPKKDPPLRLHEAVMETEELYRARRGYDTFGNPNYSGNEIHLWRLDLHRKIYVLGEDVRPTLAYIDWALAQEQETD